MSTLVVCRLDLQRLLVRPFAWTLAAIVLAALAWKFLFYLDGFLLAQPKLAANANGPGYTDLVAIRYLLFSMEWFLFLAPLITMQSIAGERSMYTLPLLFASGLSPARIVLGKFLSALIYLLILFALVVLTPVLLAQATTPDWGQFGAALLGCVLCIAAFTAIGIAASAFSSHPAVAAIVALLILLILAFLNVGEQITGFNTDWIGYLALSTHLDPFMRGLVASVDIIYFLLLTVLALAFAIRRLAAEKVRG